MDGNVDIFCFESNCDDRKVKLEENGNEISSTLVNSKTEKYRDNANKFQCHLCNEYFDQFELEMHFIECSFEENGNDVKNENCENIEDNDENETGSSCIPQPDILAKRKRSATVRYNVDFRTITRGKFKKRGKLKKKIKTKKRSEKIFQCDSCKRTFNSGTALRYHRTTHLGENQRKPFKCEICSKVFPQKSGLKQHSFIHSGEKPFKCPKCPKTFNRKETLQNHERTHTGEKPFKCRYCDKAFGFRKTLMEHEQIHTGTLFRCKRCSKRFTTQWKLDAHIMKWH